MAYSELPRLCRGDNKVENERILVTGAAGFIGSHLVDKLLIDGYEVTGIDNLSTGSIDNINHHFGKRSFRFIKGDVRDSRTVRNVVKGASVVISAAALVSGPRSIHRPLETHENNVTATLKLLEACHEVGVSKFLYISSAAVYGRARELPTSEECCPHPASPYGASKLAAENYVSVFNEVYGLDTVSLRLFNVYGPRQTSGPYGGVVSVFLDSVLKGRSPIIFGDGEQTRDFIHIKDVVEACLLAMKTDGVSGEVFNIASGQPTKISDLAKMILEIAGLRAISSVYAEPRRGDVLYSWADISKARTRLGFEPKISLMEGLAKLYEWYRSKARVV
jgi:UDP-glucose 4-epimerase